MLFLTLINSGRINVAIEQGDFVLTSIWRCLFGRPEVTLMLKKKILGRKTK